MEELRLPYASSSVMLLTLADLVWYFLHHMTIVVPFKEGTIPGYALVHQISESSVTYAKFPLKS